MKFLRLALIASVCIAFAIQVSCQELPDEQQNQNNPPAGQEQPPQPEPQPGEQPAEQPGEQPEEQSGEQPGPHHGHHGHHRHHRHHHRGNRSCRFNHKHFGQFKQCFSTHFPESSLNSSFFDFHKQWFHHEFNSSDESFLHHHHRHCNHTFNHTQFDNFHSCLGESFNATINGNFIDNARQWFKRNGERFGNFTHHHRRHHHGFGRGGRDNCENLTALTDAERTAFQDCSPSFLNSSSFPHNFHSFNLSSLHLQRFNWHQFKNLNETHFDGFKKCLGEKLNEPIDNEFLQVQGKSYRCEIIAKFQPQREEETTSAPEPTTTITLAP